MPIPELTTEGYLPVGEFDCDLPEMETVFGLNEHRSELLRKFRAFLTWLRDHHDLDLPYFVDGSYTTAKANPGDIDFILDLSDATERQIASALRLFSFHQAEIKNLFSVDFWFYHPEAENDLRKFFKYVRVDELQQRQLPPSTRKGILRVRP